ncbi:hypothetical protein D3C73_1365690 [compost metagenome]
MRDLNDAFTGRSRFQAMKEVKDVLVIEQGALLGLIRRTPGAMTAFPRQDVDHFVHCSLKNIIRRFNQSMHNLLPEKKTV